jgi:hypothetical protein
MRGPPRRIQLTVKTARIAHNRHVPEPKNEISVPVPVCHHVVYGKTYPLVLESIPHGAEDAALRVPRVVGATAYAMWVAALAIDALLDGLNPQQRAAVVHEGGPLLIVAGAGSGKTRVLTHRIAYLLAARDVAPQEILAITFTNKAAGEMAARVAALVGPRSRSMWVMTFHSACVRILRREAKRFGYPSSFSIYDQADSQRLMTLTCRELELDAKQFPPKMMAAQVSNLKNELIDHETFAARAQTAREKALAEAYTEYQSRLFAAGAMDFDDLIMVTVNLLQAFPEVAETYRRRFRHVLVDEYQDTNRLQAEILHALKPDGSGLVVVGDDAQAIYSFRAAAVENILGFAERFQPAAEVVTLAQNYRSTQPVLDVANAVMAEAPRQHRKYLLSVRGDGARPRAVTVDELQTQAEYVCTEVLRRREASVPLKRQAVLFRTSSHSDLLEVELTKRKIPFVKYGGLKFLEAAHIKDLLAVLRWADNPHNALAAFRTLQLLPGMGIIWRPALIRSSRSRASSPRRPPRSTGNGWWSCCSRSPIHSGPGTGSSARRASGTGGTSSASTSSSTPAWAILSSWNCSPGSTRPASASSPRLPSIRPTPRATCRGARRSKRISWCSRRSTRPRVWSGTRSMC